MFWRQNSILTRNIKYYVTRIINIKLIQFCGAKEDVGMLARKAVEDAQLWIKVNTDLNILRDVNTKVFTRGECSWKRPKMDSVKCNINESWVNKHDLSGGAWLVRDHHGHALYHSRDAFSPSECCIMVELWCMVWALEALRDLHILKVEVATNCVSAVEAILRPLEWPRYRNLLDKIRHLISGFERCHVYAVALSANSIARSITTRSADLSIGPLSATTLES